MNRDAMINAAAQVLQDTEIDMDYVDRAAAILDAIHPELKPVPPAPAKTVNEREAAMIVDDIFFDLPGTGDLLKGSISRALDARDAQHKAAMEDLRSRCALAAREQGHSTVIENYIRAVPLEGGAQ